MAEHTNLLPREHGAYAELGFPLVTGLALAVPSPAALALGVAVVALFLAHEPVAILLGARGKRLQDREGGRARARMTVLLGVGGFLAGAGLLGAGGSIWPEALIPAVAGVLLIPIVRAGRLKTVPGELLVVTTFSTVTLPLAAASGVSLTRAALAAGVWWISFALGTLQVHAIKTRHKQTGRNRWALWASPLASGTAVLVAVWAALGLANPMLRTWAGGAGEAFDGGATGGAAALGEGGRLAVEAMHALPPAAAALLPPAVTLLILSLLRVHPRNLKRVGWTLVAANTLTLILLLQG